jgi:hypothetical protein
MFGILYHGTKKGSNGFLRDGAKVVQDLRILVQIKNPTTRVRRFNKLL